MLFISYFIFMVLLGKFDCRSIAENDSITQTAFITRIDTGSNLLTRDHKNKTENGGEEKAETRSKISSRSSKSESIKRCESSECKHLAKRIKESLNTSVNPCTNFYDFACGGWISSKKIPSCENEITSFTVLTKEIENQIKGLISDKPKTGESDALGKARAFYDSCANNKTIEQLGAKPALDFIDSIGGWSICNNSKWMNGQRDKWNVYKVMENIQKTYYPAPPFMSFEVTNDHMNSSKHLIKIDQSGLSLQSEIYRKLHKEKPDILEAYKKYMVKIAKLLNYTCPTVDEEMKEILDFEMRLSKITTPAEDKQAGTFRRINLKILEMCIPQFPWLKHARGIFPQDAKIQRNDVVLATSPKYLYKVADLMKSKSKKLLSKYIVWQMLRDKISFLSSEFRNARADFNREMTGVEDTEERWRWCTTVTNDNMGVPIGTLYVNKYFSENTRKKTQLMVDEVINAFKGRIEDHDWIDNKTKSHVEAKAEAMVAKLGHASYITNITALDARFKTLNISNTSFFNNNLNVDRWIRLRLFNKLRKNVDKSKWPMFPQTINAMYQFYENEIVIPAGILQPPFFYHNEAIPMSLSYGGIGSIIGHEITHGFDNTGRKFDKNGDIKGEQWTSSSRDNFDRKSKCLVQQYNNYLVQGKFKVSGKLTLGENIADNGGVKLAYDAYQDWLGKEKSRSQEVLPELDYNNNQLFFIGFAQQYCAKIRSKTEQLATLSEIHSPSRFRVIGSLSNMEAFSKAFECPKDAPMNPPRKCEVW